MWRASSWRLLCCWLAAFMHEIIILYDCHVQEKKTKKPDHAAGKRRMDGSFSCQSIPRMLTVCTFTLWLMVKNGRSITFPPWTMVYRLSIMTLWARGIMPRFARRGAEKPLHAVWKWPQKSIFSTRRWTSVKSWTFRIHHFWKIFSLTSSLTVYVDAVYDSTYSYHKVNFKHYDHVF